MDPMDRITRYVTDVRFEDLPASAVEATKKAVVDTIGAGLAGSSAPLGRLVVDMVRDWGGKQQSSLLVYGDRLPAPEAAFANVTMARCRELDDVHDGNPRRGIGVGGHVHVMFVPAALAMAETSPAPVSGQKLILAIAVGGDVAVRIRVAAGKMEAIGWISETVSPLGVVASAAKVLDLDRETVANAMGAAFAHCSGTTQSTTDGTWDIWLLAGIGAKAGITAVELARRGHIGSKSPLLGRSGLYPMYFRNEFHEDILFAGLGKEFEGASASIKPYSSCKATHHAIYTTLELVRKHNLKAEQIDRIAVETSTYNTHLVVLNEKGEHKYAPRNLNEAQFSMPFTVAMAVVKRSVFPDVLTEDSLTDPGILQLSRKVAVKATPEMDEIVKKVGLPPDKVSIYTRDGQVYSGSDPFVKGHPENPFSFEECVDKFRRCAKLLAKPISQKKLDGFLEQAGRLEEVDDVRPLVASLS